MKKVILLIAVALVGMLNTNAQKQVGGDKNLEAQFTPWGDSPIGIDGLRFRMFNGDGTGAIRLSLWLGGTTVETVNTQPGIIEQDQPELLTTNKTSMIGLAPGYEKHFEGTDRLSPYVGGQLYFMMNSHNDETEFYNSNDFNDPDNYVVWTTTEKGGSSTIGLDVLAGTDFYFSDNIYLGIEILLGFASTNDKDDDFEVSDTDAFKIANGIPEDTEVTFDPYVNGGHSNWGPRAQSTIRVGWLLN